MLASTRPAALADKPPSGLNTTSLSQSEPSASALAVRCFLAGGSLPPSVMVIITEISAMPSPMQWCSRAIRALPPS